MVLDEAVIDARQEIDLRPMDVALVSTFPPTRCGIGRFSDSLCRAWSRIAPTCRVNLARIITASDHPLEMGRVDSIFDPASAAAIRATARRVNRSHVALVQHEYGIYGPDDGEAVVDLVRRITIPQLVVLHTVLPRPSARQRSIVEQLAATARLVVPSHVARDLLVQSYPVTPSQVSVIPHGSSWTPKGTPRVERRRLITWGLLGPGKGIERVLRALSRFEIEPSVTYDVVGQTHPGVLSTSGQSYRRSLLALTRDLGLDERVNFIDRYVEDAELEQLVGAADVVVIPYDNDEQTCSGVLTDAQAIGKPVVATAFPHARELLEGGGGICVDHTPEAMAEGIIRLLTDDAAYRSTAASARLRAPSLAWDRVASAYLRLMHEARKRVGVA